MSAPVTRTQVPDGVRDRLPAEAAGMRRLSARLDSVFRTWGYREVCPPVIEYLEAVSVGAANWGRREDLYQFFDRKGRTLALRPDMTTPIARLVATRLTDEPLPLRLSYFAPVFRHRELRAGATSEIWQAGVELVGASGEAADAEVISLACAAVKAAELDGFRIGLGHVGIVEGLFESAGVAPGAAAALKEAMVSRDLVAFEHGVAQAGLSGEQADLLLGLVHFHGSFREAMDRFGGIGGRVTAALQHLGRVLEVLEALGVADQVNLDLGLVRSLGYYTGVVFEGYLPGIGQPVMGGGRYDNLVAEFGRPLAATGFALEVDRLLMAQEQQRAPAAEAGLDAVIACPPGQEAKAMAWAARLRAQGLAVEVDLLGRTGEALAAYARCRGAARVLSPGVPPIH